MEQFPELPVTKIENFELKILSKAMILFQILLTKIITFDNTTEVTSRFRLI